jgi:hypothetical protein
MAEKYKKKDLACQLNMDLISWHVFDVCRALIVLLTDGKVVCFARMTIYFSQEVMRNILN